MKTKLIIEIESDKIKPYIEDGEDYSKDMQREWHKFIAKEIEDWVHDDSFETEVMAHWNDEAEFLNPKAREFSDIGELMIRMTEENDNGK